MLLVSMLTVHHTDCHPWGLQVPRQSFAYTGQTMRAMEAAAVAISQQEPLLLVGETGTGKTTLVQQIAQQVSALPYSESCTSPCREPVLPDCWGDCKGWVHGKGALA